MKKVINNHCFYYFYSSFLVLKINDIIKKVLIF